MSRLSERRTRIALVFTLAGLVGIVVTLFARTSRSYRRLATSA